MKQSIKNPAERAMIKGVPVYSLSGVTTDNLPVIKGTQMWVQYRHLGDAGWYLAVPDAWFDAAVDGLGDHGLELASVARLPERSNFLFGLGMALCCFSVPFLAGLAPDIDSDTHGTLIILSVVAFFVAMAFRAGGNASYGALLATVGGGRGGALDADSTFHYPYGSAGSLPLPGDLAYAFRR